MFRTKRKPRETGIDLSPEAIERRRNATAFAHAANVRQGYVDDPILEDAKARYVAGEITLEEFGEEMRASIART
ncbi:antitoxin VbhA family protein [Mesorhizobium sp. P16.1]|uniref:antitoxin VbhA family protein n=1 Tax=unclassified Mesorhizobium TaxID=325217 RepID=UPI0021A7FE94|nr:MULTISPECIES: antitoxin VbhA family protein [unclassified Mesorhizobium]MCT2580888.1 antitoxin VbhA family protein [Mesorhizobium sp. P13.3]MDF3169973.1 antitoxin VbhA family protein [Mesorhizobium sp. P16.1]MDF3181203.1 antitoxin VbhA family protein [Mesorhizobium sp. P17.1]MDF3186852.1 antitoxin VbhA family protein [Mesorhizobium sp. ICCV3110.1]